MIALGHGLKESEIVQICKGSLKVRKTNTGAAFDSHNIAPTTTTTSTGLGLHAFARHHSSRHQRRQHSARLERRRQIRFVRAWFASHSLMFHCFVADFGVSYLMELNPGQDAKTFIGTPYWYVLKKTKKPKKMFFIFFKKKKKGWLLKSSIPRVVVRRTTLK